MQRKRNRRLSPLILCMALIAAMALFTIGCNGSTGNGDRGNSSQTVQNAAGADAQAEPEQLGEGSTIFLFTVVDKDGNETLFEIHTDQDTVGAALWELELISGDESEYGLYVKTVNGITADYDKDGVYWAFYINGEYASTGVDATEITEGDSYSFRVE
ncbi:MAG: DUF4430 domain-containing protein [Blautia sp.]|nr:DUF4430 domain-containing protein [Blautia sp.]